MKKIIFALILAIIFPHQSSAMEGGVDAVNDTRTVAISSHNGWKNCTGFLYSERIVLTAGHCVFNHMSKPLSIRPNLAVGYPGTKYTSSSEKVYVEKVFVSDNFQWHGKENFTDINDFGVLVLRTPIKISGKTYIASKEKIDQYFNNNIKISTVGYGRQKVGHGFNDDTFPQYAEFPLVSKLMAADKVKMVWQYEGIERKYGMTIHVLQIPGGPSSCGGDSGSPFFVKEGEDFVYLGPLAWGIGGIPNCSGDPWKDEMYMGSVAAYDYLYLIEQAENYVGGNTVEMAVANKTTIKCIKNKKIKNITSIKPKCPKGYKLNK